jgi:alginate O-acetyltransferase complex protein AlgI
MLFNSYEFILIFLPLTLAVFALLGGRGGGRPALAWLTLASLFFYGWWNPIYLILLLASLTANYVIGSALAAQAERSGGTGDKPLLIAGIIGNLAVLGYYKYANFFLDNVNALSGSDWHVEAIILPLGISFITFQKIAFLVDSWSGKVKRVDWLGFALFVTFFPQLIAGPIVHHAEVMPQFKDKRIFGIKAENLAIGLTIFAIGLFKKAVLADGIAVYADPVFQAAEQGQPLSFFEAWGGTLAYTFQLYFDFSGYSDMAVGAARLFGIVLPINFNSPYKATNIIDFWRRWHISLSHFLRDYLYIGLGGNRKGPARRYVNLFMTMLIGGLWHGAGWTFVVWGALHGSYLIINHGVRAVRAKLGGIWMRSSWGERRLAQLITFLAVVVGWVFFRATSFESAVVILTGMVGGHGVALPQAILAALGGLGASLQALGVTESSQGGTVFIFTWGWIVLLGLIAFLAPNSSDVTRHYKPVLTTPDITKEHASGPGKLAARLESIAWRPTLGWALFAGGLFVLGLFALPEVSAFLYFQF